MKLVFLIACSLGAQTRLDMGQVRATTPSALGCSITQAQTCGTTVALSQLRRLSANQAKPNCTLQNVRITGTGKVVTALECQIPCPFVTLDSTNTVQPAACDRPYFISVGTTQ